MITEIRHVHEDGSLSVHEQRDRCAICDGWQTAWVSRSRELEHALLAVVEADPGSVLGQATHMARIVLARPDPKVP